MSERTFGFLLEVVKKMVNKRIPLIKLKNHEQDYYYVTTRIRMELVFDISDEGCFFDSLDEAVADYRKMKRICPTYHLYAMHKKKLIDTIKPEAMFENLIDLIEETEFSDFNWLDNELSRGRESFIESINKWKQQFKNSTYGEGIVGEIVNI